MLFNSVEFILFFFPLALFGYYSSKKVHPLGSIIWLSLISLVFYGYWNSNYLPLILASITFNYAMGRCISYSRLNISLSAGMTILSCAIGINLLLLGYYKYADFFITISNEYAHRHHPLLNIILPLGISFFTFTQIAYLVDCYRNEVTEYHFIKYILFVTYFPHLIAGPILHHKEMIPQFGKSNTIDKPLFLAGMTLFTIGLFKKVFLADNISDVANHLFAAVENGTTLTIYDSWMATLAYTLQIYFDFSAYSEMAIGLSVMFGVKLPINFYSPYKARNIIDFWRRWHMTLSRFLRDYLYVPLGGNRKGHLRRYINLMVTMVLGGFWHGAGWTFIIWGGLHGLYLVINHTWRHIYQEFNVIPHAFITSRVYQLGSLLITFIAVMIAWVFFRAPNTMVASSVLHSMAGFPSGLPTAQTIAIEHKLLMLASLSTVWLLPNSLQFLSDFDLALNNPLTVNTIASKPWYRWRITPFLWTSTALVFAITFFCMVIFSNSAQFLYFEF